MLTPGSGFRKPRSGVGRLGVERDQAAIESFAVEAMIAGLPLFSFDQNPGLFQCAGVMAQQRQRDPDGIGDLFACPFLAIGQELYDAQSGGIAEGLENFRALGQIKITHALRVPGLATPDKVKWLFNQMVKQLLD